MKFQEIKNWNQTELRKKLGQLRQELFESKIKLSMKRMPNPLKIRLLRKDMARLETALHQPQKEEKDGKTKAN